MNFCPGQVQGRCDERLRVPWDAAENGLQRVQDRQGRALHAQVGGDHPLSADFIPLLVVSHQSS
jgi:hypothetical protein